MPLLDQINRKNFILKHQIFQINHHLKFDTKVLFPLILVLIFSFFYLSFYIISQFILILPIKSIKLFDF